MKQQSVFLKIGLAFVALYTCYTAVFTIYSMDRAYIQQTKQNFMWASAYLKIGEVLLKADDSLDLTARLDEGVKNHEIDFYLLRQGDQELAYGNAAGGKDPIYLVKNVKDGMYETSSYRQFIIHAGHDYELIVGHKTSRWAYVAKFWEANKDFVFKDIGFVTLLMVLLTLYSFRDLRAIVASLSKRGARRGQSNVAKSRETLTLIKGLKGFENKVDALSDANELLTGQVLPALQKELWSGRKPPYEFETTMARIDINNFTSIFASDKRVHFMEVINEFFLNVTHIVSRYGGSVYEFIGDEVIFYFKEGRLNSAQLAAAAVRDIFELANEVNERTLSQMNYPFRVKSSLACGTLRFGPLVNGFALAGNPLIETVRILSHIHEKSENSLLFGENVRERLGSLVASRELKVVMLKGLSDARRLHQYVSHIPLSHHLRQGSIEALENTTYYRGDHEIAAMLEYVQTHLGELEQSYTLKICKLFRNYRVTKSSIEVRQSYLNLLDRLIEKVELEPKGKNEFVLASVISSGLHLFTAGELNSRIRRRLLRCMEIEDHRVRANALDIFAELEPQSGELIFEKMIDHGDNRVAANLLVRDANANWDKKTARRLSAMLKAKSAFAKSSGLYALGEIAARFKALDEVAFEADFAIQALLTEMLNLAFHANRMVRRQALRAVAKTQRVKELQDMVAAPQRGFTPEICHEIEDWLTAEAEGASFDEASAGRGGNGVGIKEPLGVLRMLNSGRKSG